MPGNHYYYPELSEFYNVGNRRTAFVTFDVDWAPDCVLEKCADWLKAHGIPATFYATHDSAVLRSMASDPAFEIGIHPNFSKNDPPEEVLGYLLERYPSTRGSRSHRNFSGRNFSDAKRKAGLIYDVSKILWGHAHCECVPMYNGMIEAPYSWEDGTHLELALPPSINEARLDNPGLKILAFHPLLWDLNCSSYEELKRFNSQYRNLPAVPVGEFDRARRTTRGMGDFSRELLLELKRRNYQFLLVGDLMTRAHALETSRSRQVW